MKLIGNMILTPLADTHCGWCFGEKQKDDCSDRGIELEMIALFLFSRSLLEGINRGSDNASP